jgi:hypothetical protein
LIPKATRERGGNSRSQAKRRRHIDLSQSITDLDVDLAVRSALRGLLQNSAA